MSKPFVPTREQRDNVEAMAAYGIPQTEIARLIKNPETGAHIDDDTLRLHFREELDTGLTKANAKMAASMFKMGTEGEASSAKLGAASFWLARRANWKETSVQEHVGKDGGPMQIEAARQRLIDELDRVAARKEEKEPTE